ncbi:hypothetical protein BW723_15765 [Polaribacter reichenbachii]|uniref:Cyanobacterial TRADD-N associated 2 transmembrane domain-containing protein n=1 Tax=Polaribacter reichenbachii TaxID=996801 RepID=A0A1B8U548_9FLAO|nr:hypothetical protein [Polaribacter reichenbachii]APZ47656.1 hypothetical protein BW723_15765 [Polaribacter reichenbachii]AUC18296.1 hypothetical protein BTO17_06210 [Polaribacter reichenbachii]OBY66991.1 hypothetical protein LPB301_04020 [Polaribacter reichenbachii]
MSLFNDIIEGLIKGFTSSNKNLKLIVKVSIAFVILAILVVLVGELKADDVNKKSFDLVAGVLGLVGAFLGFGIKVYEDTKENEKRAEKIESLEKEIKEKPDESQTAWELARLKLESYLNKNLKQVSSIFYLSATVMLVGFGLIIFGVYKVYSNPELLNPSILVTCTGVIVNFIGGTLLLIYRSTMNQAKGYVEVLERINAVGMSIQILESIDDKNLELKDSTTAEIAKELLKIYGKNNLKSTVGNTV